MANQTTIDKGNLSLTKVMAACQAAGYRISMPIGDGHPYDLVLDNDGTLLRCQVKTSRFRNGCIVFNTASNNGRYQKKGQKAKSYKGKIEVFGVYSSHFDSVYLVPIENTRTSVKCLRVEKSRINSSDFANKYKVETSLRGD